MSLLTILKDVRRVFLFVVLGAALLASFSSVTGFAQDAMDRKVKSRVEPTYPEVARKMGLTGTVKLQLLVAANGTVKQARALGGHPILINAAVEAVRKWRFETASSESIGIVEVRFNPGS